MPKVFSDDYYTVVAESKECARHNGGFEIGFPNLYLWIIR